MITAPALTGPLRIPCPRCPAEPGDTCTTSGGNPAQSSHVARWDAYRARMRRDAFVVTVLQDDDHTGLRAGEQYEAITYWLDPGEKCTLLRRIPDGHDPECNAYWHQIQWEAWA